MATTTLTTTSDPPAFEPTRLELSVGTLGVSVLSSEVKLLDHPWYLKDKSSMGGGSKRPTTMLSSPVLSHPAMMVFTFLINLI